MFDVFGLLDQVKQKKIVLSENSNIEGGVFRLGDKSFQLKNISYMSLSSQRGFLIPLIASGIAAYVLGQVYPYGWAGYGWLNWVLGVILFFFLLFRVVKPLWSLVMAVNSGSLHVLQDKNETFLRETKKALEEAMHSQKVSFAVDMRNQKWLVKDSNVALGNTDPVAQHRTNAT